MGGPLADRDESVVFVIVFCMRDGVGEGGVVNLSTVKCVVFYAQSCKFVCEKVANQLW
jgi:hypothetical protein